MNPGSLSLGKLFHLNSLTDICCLFSNPQSQLTLSGPHVTRETYNPYHRQVGPDPDSLYHPLGASDGESDHFSLSSSPEVLESSPGESCSEMRFTWMNGGSVLPQQPQLHMRRPSPMFPVSNSGASVLDLPSPMYDPNSSPHPLPGDRMFLSSQCTPHHQFMPHGDGPSSCRAVFPGPQGPGE